MYSNDTYNNKGYNNNNYGKKHQQSRPQTGQRSYQKQQQQCYDEDDYGVEAVRYNQPTKYQSKPNNYGGQQQSYNNNNRDQGYGFNQQQQQKPRYNNQQQQPQQQYGQGYPARYPQGAKQMNFHPNKQQQDADDAEDKWNLQPQRNNQQKQQGKKTYNQQPNGFNQKPQTAQQQRNKNPEMTNILLDDKDKQEDPWANAFSKKPRESQTSNMMSAASSEPQTQQAKQFNNGGFNKKAVASSNASALVPLNKNMKSIKVVSNQYKLSLGQNIPVHQYRIEVVGLQFYDAAQIQKILRSKRKAMDTALGLNVCSGEIIYLLSELEEDVKFNAMLNGNQYTIVIREETHTILNLQDDFTNESNSTAQQLINVIIKTAFRDTKMKQIGRQPRFFDVDQPINCAANIMIWQGFKASAFQSQMGCTLVMDSIFKFMSTQTCLQRIAEIQKNYDRTQNGQFKYAVETEFMRNSVIANWGNKRTYYVDEIAWDKTPVSQTFDYQGEEITMMDYFQRNYQMKIKNPNQPLFAVKNAGSVLYLPPEFCLTDGVPAAMRNTREMRDALAQTRIRPDQKMNKIKSMVSELFKQKAIADWGLKIEDHPIEMTTNVLTAPQLIKGNQIIQCDENELRRLPIQKAVDLGEEEWIFIYDRQCYDLANSVVDSFKKSANQLKIGVQEPYYIETENEKNIDQVEGELAHYMTEGGIFRHPKMVVILLKYENNYTAYKEIMQKFRMPSQVITRQNANKFNLSKASNILRQLNSKMGGDLYHLKFPAKMDSMRTMLIGIDVCHAGQKSVVGFSASINQDMSQYYSDYIVQQKGKEVVKDKLQERLQKALECFAENHKREFPTNLIIYRDGVGDAQREQVFQFEIQQFQETIEALYNKMSNKPAITVVFVNKRINQRFFMMDDKRGTPMNPPSGCIIDRGLSQTTSQGESKEVSDKCFDFFMTPASANQGCVLPTHFYVSRNDSTLTRLEIEQLTYALCHFYFNWAGPIKVPAPCQYAHKIADFFNTMGVAKKSLRTKCSQQHQKLEDALYKKVRPLNEKLHFL